MSSDHVQIVSGGKTYTASDLKPRLVPGQKRPGHTIWQRGVLDDPSAKILRGGVELRDRDRERALDRLRGRYDGMRPVFDPSGPAVGTKAYIPGILSLGTVPAFIGPKGWGKTTFLCRELAPALIIPGRRFLGHFDPVELSAENRARDIWMINSETRPEAVHEELIAAGLVSAKRDGVPCYVSPDLGTDAGVLIVEQLPASGGAAQFDLTDPVKFEEWETRFLEFTNRRQSPLMVIADGLTAAMRNDTGKTGAQTSAFRLLLQEAGIPNGLGVLHSPMDPRTNTPMGGVEAMAEWDGLWVAEAKSFPVQPSTTRHFSTLPRMGDPSVPRRRVKLTESGRLFYVEAGERSEAEGEPEGDPRRSALRDRLASGPLFTADLCGTGDEFKANRKALSDMERDGEVVCTTVQQGRSRGYRWSLASEVEPD